MAGVPYQRQGGFRRTVKGHADDWYGGGEEAFENKAAAYAYIPEPIRPGKTFGVWELVEGVNIIVEYYWSKDDLRDGYELPKGGGNASIDDDVISLESTYSSQKTIDVVNAAKTELRGGVVTDGDNMNKLYNLIVGQFKETSVADIPARNAYNVLSLPQNVFVIDDGDGKWALYKALTTGVGAAYTKISDEDTLHSIMSALEIKTSYESNADTNAFTDAEKLKLSGIATEATKNATDAQLRDRSTHTGTQEQSTIVGLETALQALWDAINTGAADSVFAADFLVSLSGGKNYLKWISGDTVPAQGKTARELLLMGAVEALNPTVNLNSSFTNQPYNQINVNPLLTWTYTINSLGASLSNFKLERSRGGSGTWVELLNTATPPVNYQDSVNATINNETIIYRLTITDSAGGITTVNRNITFAAYSAPTVTGLSIGTTKREKGNTVSNITGTITRQSPNIELDHYKVEYSINGAAYVQLGADIPLSGSTGNISLNHNDPALQNANTIAYRIRVVDAQQTTTSSVVTLTLEYRHFYGPAAAPSDSTTIRTLANVLTSDFAPNKSYSTGTTATVFEIAIAPGFDLQQVFDDSITSDITLDFSLVNTNFSAKDFAGIERSGYYLYRMTNVPYSPAQNQRITLKAR